MPAWAASRLFDGDASGALGLFAESWAITGLGAQPAKVARAPPVIAVSSVLRLQPSAVPGRCPAGSCASCMGRHYPSVGPGRVRLAMLEGNAWGSQPALTTERTSG